MVSSPGWRTRQESSSVCWMQARVKPYVILSFRGMERVGPRTSCSGGSYPVQLLHAKGVVQYGFAFQTSSCWCTCFRFPWFFRTWILIVITLCMASWRVKERLFMPKRYIYGEFEKKDVDHFDHRHLFGWYFAYWYSLFLYDHGLGDQVESGGRYKVHFLLKRSIDHRGTFWWWMSPALRCPTPWRSIWTFIVIQQVYPRHSWRIDRYSGPFGQEYHPFRQVRDPSTSSLSSKDRLVLRWPSRSILFPLLI